MKTIIALLISISLTGCGTYYTSDKGIEKDFISSSAGFYDPSGAYTWKMFKDGKEISLDNRKDDGIDKVIKIKILSINEKTINKDCYLWYGSIDTYHTSPDTVTSLTPTNFITFVNQTEKNNVYTIIPNKAYMITQSPVRIKDYKDQYVSVEENDKINFIREEDYIIDKNNSFQYTKYTTDYGLYGGMYYKVFLSRDRIYKRTVLKTKSKKDNSEKIFDSDYVLEFK